MKKLFVFALVLSIFNGCSKVIDESESVGEIFNWWSTPYLYGTENLGIHPDFKLYQINKNKPIDYDNIGFVLGALFVTMADEPLISTIPKTFDFDTWKSEIDSELYQSYYYERKKDLDKARDSAPFAHVRGFRETSVFDGGITSSPAVYADKTLFGLTAGENLIDYFEVYRLLTHYLFCYPEYTLKCSFANLDVEMPLSELYSPGTMLLPACNFRFREIPSEKYESLTLTIDIPVTAESVFKFLRNYDPDLVLIDTVISGSVTIEMNE